jgi:hypothetical protein
MGSDKLRVYGGAELRDSRLLMGLSGWMDGAEVSTGTIKVLVDKLHAQRIAEIDHQGFYIYNFRN